MTKKVYYEKQGRKYVPVAEYDSDLIDSFQAGTHLVMCYPGGKSYSYNIDPAYAPMIAAGRIAEDVISNAIMKAHEVRPYQNTALTNEQHEAWTKLMDVMGDRGRYIEWPSAREVAMNAVQAIEDEAVKLMTNDSVRIAYDHFLMVAALTRDDHNS